MPAVLVVGNGTSTYLSELLLPSVAKAVVNLKRVPIAIVGPASVRHCGAGERSGEVEPWEGGCVLQVCLWDCVQPCNMCPLMTGP